MIRERLEHKYCLAFERMLWKVCLTVSVGLIAMVVALLYCAATSHAYGDDLLNEPTILFPDRGVERDLAFEHHTSKPDFRTPDNRLTIPPVSKTPPSPGLNYVYPGTGTHPDLYVAPDGRMDYLYRYGGGDR